MGRFATVPFAHHARHWCLCHDDFARLECAPRKQSATDLFVDWAHLEVVPIDQRSKVVFIRDARLACGEHHARVGAAAEEGGCGGRRRAA